MFRVTNYYLWFKCYLNICMPYKKDMSNNYVVADKMRSLTSLARAIKKAYCVSSKKIKKIYSFLTILISVLPSLYSTIQVTLSPISAPRNFIISFGIVVLADKLFGRAMEILDSYSNTFISPIFVGSYIYICT